MTAPAPGRALPAQRVQLGTVLPSRVQGATVGGAASTVVQSATVQPGRGPRAATQLLQPGPALARQQTGDRQTNALQEGQRAATNQAKADPLAGKNVIEGVSLGSGWNVVQHGLGRAFRGAMLASPGVSVIWYIQRASGIAADAYQIQVHASVAVTGDLIVW